MPISESTSVIIIEDNREYREVIKLALAEVDDLRLIESFATCEIGLRFLLDASTPQPDIVLLDLRLTGMMGMEAIPYIKDYSPDSKIIVLTQSDNETDVLKAISLGATGYLLKSATVQEILTGIRNVQAGGASLDPDVAKFVLQDLKKRLPTQETKVQLSSRETEILRLLADGFVKKQIADQLNIGYTTVDTHVGHIYEKLQVRNAPSAVSMAYRLGLFSDEKE
tara:strand:+ start:4600 stop:5271 length:672 start_codon:yes stop_codon:yes gene_type:complete